jgi:hypothetical protein
MIGQEIRKSSFVGTASSLLNRTDRSSEKSALIPRRQGAKDFTQIPAMPPFLGSVKEGTFTMDVRDYAKDNFVGLGVVIEFLPNATALDSKLIKLLQVVRTFDLATNADVDYSNTTAHKLQYVKTKKDVKAGVEEGFFVDHDSENTEDRLNVAQPPVSPYYRDYRPNSDLSSNGSKAGSKIQGASLADVPSTTGRTQYSFETAAQDVDSGHTYGAMRWSFKVDGSPRQATYPSISVHDVASPTLGAAVKRFNENYGNPGTPNSPEKFVEPQPPAPK